MKDRIKQYMDYKSISAGELSSRLDVQRSNISHILNGRNKPGASFIEKFLVSFPDLDARWLLTGSGKMVETIVSTETSGLFANKETKVDVNRTG
ncbi:MAG: transcriptional regulator, partial [Draconibacterium sp.]|nr:transcriptional regulator [Draconibacterium sp.]